MNLEILNEEEFNEYAISHELCTFHQNSYWGHLKEKNGWRMDLLGFKKDKKIICATMILSKPLILGYKMFYAPRGFLIDYNDINLLKEFTTKLKEYVKKEKGVFIKIDPYVNYKEHEKDGSLTENGFNNENVINNLLSLGYIHNGFSLNAKNLQPRWISVLDIKNKDIDTLYKEFDTQRKRRISKTISLGFEIRELKKEELALFKNITSETSKRRGFIDRPLSYYENIYDLFVTNNIAKFMVTELNIGNAIKNVNKELETFKNSKIAILDEMKDKDNKTKYENQLKEIDKKIVSIENEIKELELIREKHGDKIVPMSAALFITFGKEFVYLASGSYEEFMNLNAQYFMQWKMINEAVEKKDDKYNFYGISGNFDKNNNRYGVFDFKKGFNADVIELIGEFNLIVNKPLYTFYNFSYKTYKKAKNIFK